MQSGPARFNLRPNLHPPLPRPSLGPALRALLRRESPPVRRNPSCPMHAGHRHPFAGHAIDQRDPVAIGAEEEILRRDTRIAFIRPFECWCWHPAIVAGPVSGFETARLPQPTGLSLDEIRNPKALRIAGCAGSGDEIGEGLQGIGHVPAYGGRAWRGSADAEHPSHAGAESARLRLSCRRLRGLGTLRRKVRVTHRLCALDRTHGVVSMMVSVSGVEYITPLGHVARTRKVRTPGVVSSNTLTP